MSTKRAKIDTRHCRKTIPVVKGFLHGYKNIRYNQSQAKLLTFWCPYCKDFHTHGWPAPASKSEILYGSHRIAHCYSPDSPFFEKGYYIKPYTKKELQNIKSYLGIADGDKTADVKFQLAKPQPIRPANTESRVRIKGQSICFDTGISGGGKTAGHNYKVERGNRNA